MNKKIEEALNLIQNITGNKVNIVYSNDILEKEEGMEAMILPTYNFKEYDIVLEEKYINDSSDMKYVLVAHELGHLACGHFTREYYIPLDLEYEADVFASLIVGKEAVISMLKYSEEKYIEITGESGCLEVECRIDNLNNIEVEITIEDIINFYK